MNGPGCGSGGGAGADRGEGFLYLKSGHSTVFSVVLQVTRIGLPESASPPRAQDIARELHSLFQFGRQVPVPVCNLLARFNLSTVHSIVFVPLGCAQKRVVTVLHTIDLFRPELNKRMVEQHGRCQSSCDQWADRQNASAKQCFLWTNEFGINSLKE